MNIHAVQLNSVWEDIPANQQKVIDLLSGTRCEPGDLIVLPEMFLTGFSMNPERLQPERQCEIAATIARTFGCTVLAGVVEQKTAPAPANTALVLNEKGETVSRYAKRRLFTPSSEQNHYTAGSSAAVFQWGDLLVAPLICYDLRFPELAREAIALGAEALIYIASWPMARVEHWVTLLRARAIENQAWVLGVNRCGADPQFRYPGRTLLVNPMGVIVADAADEEKVLSVTCDKESVRRWRADFPALADAGLLQ